MTHKTYSSGDSLCLFEDGDGSVRSPDLWPKLLSSSCILELFLLKLQWPLWFETNCRQGSRRCVLFKWGIVYHSFRPGPHKVFSVDNTNNTYPCSWRRRDHLHRWSFHTCWTTRTNRFKKGGGAPSPRGVSSSGERSEFMTEFSTGFIKKMKRRAQSLWVPCQLSIQSMFCTKQLRKTCIKGKQVLQQVGGKPFLEVARYYLQPQKVSGGSRYPGRPEGPSVCKQKPKRRQNLHFQTIKIWQKIYIWWRWRRTVKSNEEKEWKHRSWQSRKAH